MPTPDQQHLTIQETAQNLAAFAIDRTDLKEMLAALPQEADLNLTTIEYELGILKILSTGWGISFFMPAGDKNKTPLSESFWHMVKEISQNISTLTETTTGHQIDYFNILKERLDTYIQKLQENPEEATDLAAVMGPAFAVACKCPDNAIAILTGTKMFTLTLGAVKEYLTAITITDTEQE
ncbi:MAG TPA: hypothetical protein VJ943_07780 [Desulfotignum sp.]|nr:hypothetical protein [Desulfotignum sp.]